MSGTKLTNPDTIMQRYIHSQALTRPEDQYQDPIYSQTRNRSIMPDTLSMSVNESNNVHALEFNGLGLGCPTDIGGRRTNKTLSDSKSHVNDSLDDDPLLNDRTKAKKIHELQNRYQIPGYLLELMFVLEGYEIWLIIDDSSSMNSLTENNATRWDELQDVVRIFLKLGLLIDNDGIDVAFMNRRFKDANGKESRFTKIHTENNINSLFSERPYGITPTSETLSDVMAVPTQKPKIIVIATDGEPTDTKGRVELKEFEKILTERDHDNNFISILFCSNDEEILKVFSKWDKLIKNMDVLDDYENEKKEVLSVQGSDFDYTLGYHVFRLIASSVIKELDEIDEKKLKFDRSGKLMWGNNSKKKRSLRSLFCCK